METSTILVALSVILISYLFHKYFIKIYNYWQKRGIPCLDGALPFVGHSLPIYLFRTDISHFSVDLYNKYQNFSMVGFYQDRKPTLLLRDPDLIKTILQSAFTNFQENFLTVDFELDSLLAENPFFAKGEDWKKKRSYLSNALMSSKKLKALSASVTKVCEKFSKYLDDNVKKSNGVYEVETKELFTRFTGEVVANVGFGVEGEFFNDESNENSFKNIVHGVFEATFINRIIFALIFLFPLLNKIFRYSFLPKRIDRLLRNVTKQVIDTRRKNGTVGNDFLQLMLEVHTNKDGEIDIDGITSKAASFFVDGYETSAITLAFFAHQIACNPEVQEKLRREVNEVLEKHDGEISYESISELIYMDQALNESMRINLAFGSLMKRCSEGYTLVGNDGITCEVETGIDIILPVESIHKDPKYWENPDIYDPDRFNAERKNERPKNVFLPFGDGPRICPGMRFATMQIKAAVATMLRNFRIKTSSKTKLPLEFVYAPLKAVKGGLWIKFEPL